MASSVEVGTLPPKVRCAKMVVLKGSISAADVKKIEDYLINPVDSRLADDISRNEDASAMSKKR